MILSPQNHLVLSISIWYNRFLHELSVIQMKQDQMKCLEGILSRHGHTRLQKNETESHSAQIWRGFETISGRTSRKVAITGLTFKPWSSQSNYQPKNNWHKFVRSYLDYFLSKINDFIPGKLKKNQNFGSHFWFTCRQSYQNSLANWLIFFSFLIFRVLVVHFKKT